MGDNESEDSGVGGGEYRGVDDLLSVKGARVMVWCVGVSGVNASVVASVVSVSDWRLVCWGCCCLGRMWRQPLCLIGMKSACDDARIELLSLLFSLLLLLQELSKTAFIAADVDSTLIILFACGLVKVVGGALVIVDVEDVGVEVVDSIVGRVCGDTVLVIVFDGAALVMVDTSLLP